MSEDVQKMENGIFADSRVKKKPFFFRGKEYEFQVKEISWMEKQRIVSNCMSANKNGMGIDIARYNKEMLLKILVDTDGLFRVDAMDIMRLSDEMGNALTEQIIPDADDMDGLSEEESKNC